MTVFFTLLLWMGDGSIIGQAPKAETPEIAMKTFLQAPENYLGKVIKITGEVDAVCPMKGCWLDIKEGNKSVRVKVKDGELVFTKELVGKNVVAEGTVYKMELDHEQAVNYYRHLAEEQGTKFDPSSVSSGTVIYQLGGIGVQVK